MNSAITWPRIDFFDCLRAIAITFVLLGHYFNQILPGGAIGVSIFFCLSGYLITSILLREERLDFGAVWRFIVRRILRVMPAYVVAIGAIYLGLRITGSSNLDDFVSHLHRLFTFTFDHDTWFGMGTGVFWTLQVEFWFYITMPLLLIVVGRGKLFALVMLAMFIALTAGRFAFMDVLPGRLAFLFWFNNLLLGSMVAIADQRRILIGYLGRHYGVVSKVCLTMLILIAMFISNENRVVTWPIQALAACAITGAWILSYLGARQEVGMPLVAWFGRISYSVYLLHAIPLDFATVIPWPHLRALQHSQYWGLMLGAIAFAIALHYLIEKPFIKVGKWLTAKKGNVRPHDTLYKVTI
jgi:peptidoglycan/LPS O-acetylase OafA/YrhL